MKMKNFNTNSKILSRLIIFICIFSILSSSSVSALSKEQLNALDSGALWVNTEAAQDCADGTDEITTKGSSNEERIYNFLISDMKLKAFQAAGIMGNMKQESGFSPTALNQSSGAYGIAQWYAGRKTALQEYASARHKSISNLNIQLGYLKFELTHSYKSAVYDPMKNSDNLEQATRIWLESFERPCIPGHACDHEMTIRLPNARDVLVKYGSSSGAGDSEDSNNCASDSSGEASGEFSLPVAKKFYTQHPEWFSKPHHDYPAADIPVPSNTRVFAIAAGKVLLAPVGGSCGNGILIDAGKGVQYLYCHGSDGGSVANAKKGDSVDPGQLIMHSDNTGHSTGAHVHIQIRVDGQNRCPQSLLKDIAEGKVPDLQSLPSSGCTN
jgi:murein DD-endopeptidase MepM/ murein hydrolase activator NlpD